MYKKSMNNNNIKFKLKPYWVTGLIDAEGCFYVRLTKSKNHKTGWWIQACFQLGFHIKDKDLLLQIKSFFNETGSIYTMNNNKALLYQVRNLSEIIKVIIPHFENYPLITKKQSDFLLFKEIVKLMDKGEHLTINGLIKIVNLKASLNKGLSNELKVFFPKVIAIIRPKVDLPINIDYNWIAGFFTGEGCFSVSNNLLLRITIAQHSKDKLLMNNLMNILNCGIVSKNSNNTVVLTISKFKDIYNKIIPLFNEYNIKGVKALDFQDFCKIAKLINEKAHLTLEGSKEIRKIKLNMNKGRYIKKEKLPQVR
jgi:LAGLIDADG endonuclease